MIRSKCCKDEGLVEEKVTIKGEKRSYTFLSCGECGKGLSSKDVEKVTK